MKRIFTVFSILLLFATTTKAQPWRNMLPADTVANQTITLYEIQSVFDEYWKPFNVVKGKYMENGKMRKAAGWKQFQRWAYYWDLRVNPQTGEFPKTTASIEYDKFLAQNPAAKSSSGTWVSKGPNTTPGGYAGLGRINCVSFHPSNNNIFWIGSPSGGVWKTTDGGSTWTPLTDNNAVIGASDIAVPSDFATSNTLYIATGDRDGGSMWTIGGSYNDNNSVGVLKTTDGGSTWNTTGLTFSVSDEKTIGRLLIHPTNTSVLYAATSAGIYKTTDAGTTWTMVKAGSFIDLEFKPSDENNTLYAATTNDGIYKTTNGGTSWTQVFTASERIDLTVSANNSAVVYALLTNASGGLNGVYKSTNSGTSFSVVYNGAVSGHNLLGWATDGSDDGGQGWYDLTIIANPANANEVYVGGVNTWKSTNGGTSWTIMSHWYGGGGVAEVHADKHWFAFKNGTLYECNDGGIYKTTDGITWTHITNNLTISQMYRLGVSASNSGMVITGLQDNGSKLLSNGTWNDVYGGDGMECIIDPSNTAIQYATYANGEIHRTLNTWGSEMEISANISGGANGAWVTPYIVDQNNSQIIYVGYADVWKSTDRGNSFTKISSMNSYDKLRSMALAPSNSQVLYVADKTHLWKTTNGGSSWTEITSGLPVSTNPISYIAVKHNDPTTLWVTFGSYNANQIYQSTNGGSTWTNISTGLPNLPTMCVVQNKLNTGANELYVATDVGVFVKNGTENWQIFSSGLPRVVVAELEIYYNPTVPENSKIRAATFGRGLWESDLYNPTTAGLDAELQSVIAPTGDYCGSQTVTPSVQIKNSGNVPITSCTVKYQIDNQAVVSQTWNGTLASAASVTVNFAPITIANGSHTFVATVEAPNGGTDINAANNSESVTYNVISGQALPFTENFDGTTFPPTNWTLINSDNDKTWERTTQAGGNGTSVASAFMDFFDYSARGQRDELASPSLNLVGASAATLTFKVAYRMYSSTYVDTLKVYISENCGTSFAAIPIYNKFGSQLATGANQSTEFFPSQASDWRTETIDLTAYSGKSIVLKFVGINDYSNNLFIDDINITGVFGTVAGTASANPTTVCSGNTSVISLTGYAGNIQWQQSSNGTSGWANVSGGSGQNAAAFTTAALSSTTFYRAEITLPNYSAVYSNVVQVSVNNVPVQAAAPTGATTVCGNGTNSNLTTTGATGATAYVWALSPANAGTITGTTSSATVDWSNTFTGTASVTVKGTNSCGSGVFSAPLNVDVQNPPAAPASISGETALCQNPTNKTYSITAVSGATAYTWTLTPANAGTITGSGISVSIDWNDTYTGNATLSVSSQNSCGSSTAATLQITVAATPAQATTPSGNTQLCINSANTTYSSSANFATSFAWNLLPLEAGSVSGTTTTATVDWNNTFVGTATLTATGSNNCGTGAASNALTINVGDMPAQAATPSGDNEVCNNAANSTYTTTGASGATSYSWVLTPQTAGTIVGSGTSTEINWSENYSGQATLTVTGVNSCGNGTVSNGLIINISAAPQTPAAIVGETALCQNAANTNYSTNGSTGATAYTWTLNPANAGTIVGSGTSITVDWNDTFTGNATLSVVGENDCGTSTAATLAVEILQAPAQPEAPSGETILCQNAENTEYTTEIVNGATNYIWSISPSNAGNMISNNTTAVVDWLETFSGTATIGVSAQNDCGESEASFVDVTLTPAAEAIFSFTVSGLTVSFLNESLNADSYSWNFGDGFSSQEENPTHTYSTDNSYMVILTATSEVCEDTQNQSIAVTGIEQIENLLQIVPNPNNGVFELRINRTISEPLEILVYDMYGQNVYRSTVMPAESAQNRTIDLHSFGKGTYLLHCFNNETTIIQKIIVQ